MSSQGERFSEVYRRSLWLTRGVISGPGSSVENCAGIIGWLDECAEDGLRTVIDLGCGDLEWIARSSAVTEGRMSYEGWDVVPSLIAHHRRVFPWFRGRVVDLEEVTTARADVVILKDVIFHHCNGFAEQLLMNVDAGKWKRLLVTSHPGADHSKRRGLRRGGAWAPFDVEWTRLIHGEPVARLPRYDGCYLVYQR